MVRNIDLTFFFLSSSEVKIIERILSVDQGHGSFLLQNVSPIVKKNLKIKGLSETYV